MITNNRTQREGARKEQMLGGERSKVREEEGEQVGGPAGKERIYPQDKVPGEQQQQCDLICV